MDDFNEPQVEFNMQTELRESFECSDASSFLERGQLVGLDTTLLWELGCHCQFGWCLPTRERERDTIGRAFKNGFHVYVYLDRNAVVYVCHYLHHMHSIVVDCRCVARIVSVRSYLVETQL